MQQVISAFAGLKAYEFFSSDIILLIHKRYYGYLPRIISTNQLFFSLTCLIDKSKKQVSTHIVR